MDVLIALALLAAGPGEPALAGGPSHPCAHVERPIDDLTETRSEPRPGRSAHPCDSNRASAADRAQRHGDARARARSDAHAVDSPARHGAAERAIRAGDPVRLDAAFFAAQLSGGVERPAPARLYGRRGVIVLTPGPGRAPVSAGEAAAARGLPQG